MAEHQFFASCAIGAEEILRAEIEAARAFCLDVEGKPSTAEFKIISEEKGGLEFSAALEVGFALNHWLKIANRIWLRHAQFPAKSPMRMQERLRKMDFKSFFGGQPFQFEVEAHTCQIHNEKQIRRWAEDIWTLNPESPFKVFLRGVNDEWTLSIDTSGDHLHKRGNRPHSGSAPLRETHAAFSLRLLLQGEPWARRQKVALLDPMAGSGTFLMEAWQLDRPVTGREFTFQKFRNCPKILLSEAYWKNLNPDWTLMGEKGWGQLIAADNDPEMKALLETTSQLSGGVQIHIKDSLASKTRADWGLKSDEVLWVVVNPPYGERLDGLTWVKELGPWMKSLSAEKLLLWCPEKLRASVLRNFSEPPESEIRLSNGGIPCSVLVWRNPVPA